MNEKYELTAETKVACGITLYRIRALRDFAGVIAGELGGWVQAEANLSVSGAAWVFGDARVFGNAWVSGEAQVSGKAQVSGDASLLTMGQLGSRAATLTICADATLGYAVSTGCFHGSLDEFEAAVNATHGDNEHGRIYRAAIVFIRARFGIATKQRKRAKKAA